MDVNLYLIIGAFVVIMLLMIMRRPAIPTPLSGLDKAHFVPKELYATISTQHETLRQELAVKEQELRESYAQLAARDQAVLHLEQMLKTQKGEVENLQQRFKIEFENIANRLLEEKSQRFTDQNAQHMQAILAPLREKIQEFETNVDRKFLEETREKASLKTEIGQLRDLNQQLSQDAHNLTAALKGQSKVQGNWGELQLEVLLEKAGLLKGTHFSTQSSFRNQEGQQKRPDFIIQLPDNKHLVVDAKVSLTAFERYYNTEDSIQRDQHLRAHIASIRSHVDNLSSTNYQLLYQINTPDYLLLFVPLEHALTVASQADPNLFTDALDRNIVIVTTSSLLATMRTVAHLWKQEKQNRSVQEIARQSGLLYDKFVAFVDDLKAIGLRLDGARNAYDEAMNKLTSAVRPGDTLIGKAEKIKELGARSTKSLPTELVEMAREQAEEIS